MAMGKPPGNVCPASGAVSVITGNSLSSFEDEFFEHATQQMQKARRMNACFTSLKYNLSEGKQMLLIVEEIVELASFFFCRAADLALSLPCMKAGGLEL